MKSRLVALALAGAFAALAPSTRAQVVRGTYIDEELGFRVRVPDDWSEIPVRIDENWIVAKFLSSKTWLSKSRDWNEEHRPLMTVIVFTEDAKRFQGWAKTRRGNTTFVRITELPYQNYRDYLKRNLESGYFYDTEDETEIAGCKVSRFEILQHKSEPKKRLFTHVFHGEDMDVAIEIEVLEDRIDRLRSVCEHTLQSFRFDDGGKLSAAGPSTGSKDAATEDSTLWTKFRDEWKKAPAEERLRIRKDIEERRFDRLRKSTPDSWKVFDTENFLVITHADDKITKKYVESLESFRDWCDEHFGGLSDDYVRKGVLRICNDRAEYEAYRYKVSGDSWTALLDEDREVVTYQDSYSGSSGEGIAELFDDVLEMYLADVDPLLLQYTPSWLRTGLTNYVTAAWMKGRKIDFRVDDWEREDMKQAERDDKLLSLRELTSLDEETYWKELRVERSIRSQLTTAFRFIMGPGRGQKALRTFLHDYMAAVIEIAAKHREEWEALPTTYEKAAETEEEEEARAKKQRTDEGWGKRRKALLEELNQRMLGFDGKTWDRLQRAYERFAKN